MTPHLIKKLAAVHPDRCAWEPGAILTRQGKGSDALHIVLEGELEIWVTDGEKAQLRDTVGRGELIGEFAMLSPGPATATVRAGRPCTTLRVRRADLEALHDSDPSLTTALVGELVRTAAGRLREITCEVAA